MLLKELNSWIYQKCIEGLEDIKIAIALMKWLYWYQLSNIFKLHSSNFILIINL